MNGTKELSARKLSIAGRYRAQRQRKKPNELSRTNTTIPNSRLTAGFPTNYCTVVYMHVKHKAKKLESQVTKLEAALVSANEKAADAKAKALEGKVKKALEAAEKKHQVTW